MDTNKPLPAYPVRVTKAGVVRRADGPERGCAVGTVARNRTGGGWHYITFIGDIHRVTGFRTKAAAIAALTMGIDSEGRDA